MGLRGPPPTPTKTLQFRGTYRADRHGNPADEPQFEPLKVLPPCPGLLDDTARYEWARVGPELVAKELLCEADLTLFATYCTIVSDLAACEKALRASGLTYRDPNGYVVPRPEVRIREKARAELRQYAQHFGLSPSARTKVRVTPSAPAKPSNPFADTAANE